MANNEQQAELQVNNEQVTDFIINTDNQMRSVERLLDIAIFELSGMEISEKKARKERDDIIAFLNGAKALAETSIVSTKTIMEELNF